MKSEVIELIRREQTKIKRHYYINSLSVKFSFLNAVELAIQIDTQLNNVTWLQHKTFTWKNLSKGKFL